MFLFNRDKGSLPTQENALPGRSEPILPNPAPHRVLGTPIAGPYPEGFQIAEFALGCFWGEEKTFWEQPGVWTTAVATRVAITPNPTYQESCTGRTGHAETVRVVFDPAKTSYEKLLKVFWENHDPTQGMRQGNDIRLEYRSVIFVHDDAQKVAAEESKRMYQEQLTAPRLWRDHDRDRRAAGAAVLLRRGLPPAVPEGEPERLLPQPRDGHQAARRLGDHAAPVRRVGIATVGKPGASRQ